MDECSRREGISPWLGRFIANSFSRFNTRIPTGNHQPLALANAVIVIELQDPSGDILDLCKWADAM